MIYFDNAATTKVYDEVMPDIQKYMTEYYFNPSALYCGAVEVGKAIKAARTMIANILQVDSSTITFTSSGTESNNHVLFSARKRKGSRIIISALEHAAVYNAANELKQQGYDVVSCPVKADGSVDVFAFSNLLDDNTSLVAIMHINNETGAINDIEELVKITKAYNKNIHFHSDGVQAFCKIPVSLNRINVDSYSISGHKIGAPKGIAGLYVKRGIHLKPFIFGGGQESGMRSSTENVAGIIAFGKAAVISSNNMDNLMAKSAKIFSYIKQKLATIDNCVVITPDNTSAPHIFTIALPDVKGEVLLHALETNDIIIGTGSACTSKKGLKRLPDAIKLPKEYTDNIIRLSITHNNTYEEAICVARAIIEEHKILCKYIRG